jgi:hypothetical protein
VGRAFKATEEIAVKQAWQYHCSLSRDYAHTR